MGTDIEKWLKEDGEKVLKEIGIKEGQVILDAAQEFILCLLQK